MGDFRHAPRGVPSGSVFLTYDEVAEQTSDRGAAHLNNKFCKGKKNASSKEHTPG
jgi:hypothetical protein